MLRRWLTRNLRAHYSLGNNPVTFLLEAHCTNFVVYENTCYLYKYTEKDVCVYMYIYTYSLYFKFYILYAACYTC